VELSKGGQVLIVAIFIVLGSYIIFANIAQNRTYSDGIGVLLYALTLTQPTTRKVITVILNLNFGTQVKDKSNTNLLNLKNSRDPVIIQQVILGNDKGEAHLKSKEKRELQLNSEESMIVGTLGDLHGAFSIDYIRDKLIERTFNNVFLNIKLFNHNSWENYTFSDDRKRRVIILKYVPNWNESPKLMYDKLLDLSNEYMLNEKEAFDIFNKQLIKLGLDSLAKQEILVKNGDSYSMSSSMWRSWTRQKNILKSYFDKNPFSDKHSTNELVFYSLDNFVLSKRISRFDFLYEQHRETLDEEMYQYEKARAKEREEPNYKTLHRFMDSWNKPLPPLKRRIWPLETELKVYYSNEVGKEGLVNKLLVSVTAGEEYLLKTIIDKAKYPSELSDHEKILLAKQHEDL
jgi:hypothetical protein